MGKEETKARVLKVAAQLFAEDSFERVTVRQIGAAAGVDPALINHHFGGKDNLFSEVVSSAVAVNLGNLDISSIPLDELGPRLVEFADRMWSSPAQHGLTAALRRALGSKSELLGSIVTDNIMDVIASRLECDPEEGRLRAALAGSQIGGMILARHILAVPLLADLSAEEVVAYVGPRVQRDLTGVLDQ